LHVSFEDDRGGNNITVTAALNVDSCLVESAVGTNVADAVDELIDTIAPEMQTKWNASDPREWANESFAIAEAA
jgi:hypothetical protein